MARAICELWDLLSHEEVYLEYDLIDAIKNLLVEYPDPDHLEKMVNLFESIVNHSGLNYHHLYFELLLAAREHMDESLNRVVMASRIKRHFKKAISDPSYKMCKDRLIREYANINGNIESV